MKGSILFSFLGAILAVAVAIDIPIKILSSGEKIPVAGLGTCMAFGEALENALEVALEAGYRLFDTANLYGNEATIGKVINRWISEGKLKREDVFIITKIPPTGNRPADVERFLNKSLENLKLDYIDLLLNHVPFGFQYVEGNYFPRDKNNNIWMDNSTDIVAVWKAMENEVKSGKVKSIGVSNFNQTQMERIINNAEIKPAAVEIELHAYFQENSLVKYCQDNNIKVIAYSPLGAPGVNDFLRPFGVHQNISGDLDDAVVKALAEKYNKTEAQILVRHAIQKDLIVIPKSVRPERILKNVDVFNFELCKEDMEKLNNLDKGINGIVYDFTFLPGTPQHPEYPFTERMNFKPDKNVS